MVAITPMFISDLMTSVAFTAILLASSATVVVAPIATSRTTGALGFSNPWRGSPSAATAPRILTGFIAPTGVATDDTTKEFFSSLVLGRELASFYSFEKYLPLLASAAIRSAAVFVDDAGTRNYAAWSDAEKLLLNEFLYLD